MYRSTVLSMFLAALFVFAQSCADDDEGTDVGPTTTGPDAPTDMQGDASTVDGIDRPDAESDAFEDDVETDPILDLATEEPTEDPSIPPDVDTDETVDTAQDPVATDGESEVDTEDAVDEPDLVFVEVEAEPLPTPPVVLESVPADTATQVDPTGGEIVVVFNESMNSSLTPAVSFAAYDGTTYVAIPNSYVSVDWATTTVTDDTLFIDSAWIHFPENQTLRWTITAADLQNLEGTPIAGDIQREFSTTTRNVAYPAVGTAQSSCYYYDVSTWTEDASCSESYSVGSADYPYGQDAHYPDSLPAPSYVGPTETAGLFVTVDEVTGLQWTSCPLGTTGSDCSGTPTDFSWFETFDACAALNALSASSWRVPTVMELQSLITHDPANTYAIYWTHFPYFTPNAWTSTGAPGDSDIGEALRVAFGSGLFDHSPETQVLDLLCVSDVASEAQPRAYVDNGDGTVSDPVNQLRWLECTARTEPTDPCVGSVLQGTWATTLAYCENVVFGDLDWRGRTSWRLPSGSELRSLYDFSGVPTADGDYFETLLPNVYSHSTTRDQWDDTLESAYSGQGRFTVPRLKSQNFVIRCVADYCMPNRGGLPIVDCVDADGDGYGDGTDCIAVDCDDADPTTYPGAAPIETNPELCRRDADGDGFGDNTATGAVAPGTDCDDTDLLTNPMGLELPNDGMDNTCMGGSDLVPSNAAGRFVASTGNDTTGTGDMDAPYLTISHALTQTSESQVIFVAAGDYSESVDATKSIFGGYESTGWTRDIETNTTRIIDAYPVELHASGIVVQGFTLQGTVDFNGANTMLVDNHVLGAVRAQSTAPDGIVVAYNTIETTLGHTHALGIYVDGLVEGNVFMEIPSENVHGYGVRVGDDAFVTIRNNTFEPNSANAYSRRGIFVQGTSTVRVERNIIETGVGQFWSYGVEVQSGTAVLIGNLILTGESPQRIPVVIGTPSPVVLINNTLIAGSSANSIGLDLDVDSDVFAINNVIIADDYAIQHYASAHLSLIGNAFWGPESFNPLRVGTSDITETCRELNSCRWDGCIESEANIMNPPLFADADGGDYQLTVDSQYIDASVNPVRWYETTVGPDLIDNSRGQGAGWDIGAYEYTD